MTTLEIKPASASNILLETPLYGCHNVSNLLAVSVLADHLGIEPDVFRKAARSFKGVRRRQEVRGELHGITVIDDFAHHPTAVSETVRAVREKYVDRRIIAVFEPRSNSSRRKIFQKSYAESFDPADLVFIADPPLMEKIPPEDRFSSMALVEDLNHRGIQALHAQSTHALLKSLVGRLCEGDVVLVMSNGSFDGLVNNLLNLLSNP